MVKIEFAELDGETYDRLSAALKAKSQDIVGSIINRSASKSGDGKSICRGVTVEVKAREETDKRVSQEITQAFASAITDFLERRGRKEIPAEAVTTPVEL